MKYTEKHPNHDPDDEMDAFNLIKKSYDDIVPFDFDQVFNDARYIFNIIYLITILTATIIKVTNKSDYLKMCTFIIIIFTFLRNNNIIIKYIERNINLFLHCF